MGHDLDLQGQVGQGSAEVGQVGGQVAGVGVGGQVGGDGSEFGPGREVSGQQVNEVVEGGDQGIARGQVGEVGGEAVEERGQVV